MNRIDIRLPLCVVVIAIACSTDAPMAETESSQPQQYATIRLTADLSGLSEQERGMIPLLIQAAEQMDDIFWRQTYGNRDSLLESIDDEQLRLLVERNYGPWDRLGNDAPLLQNVGPKSPGARFYPADMTKAEFEAALDAPAERRAELQSLYTLVRRSEDGTLATQSYHEAFPEQTRIAAERLRDAAALAEEPDLKRYLELRAEALLRDDYRESDLAWMAMKDNTLDVVIGPIETYEDQLFGYKASHEAYVLIKDKSWSNRLARYAAFLPQLQRGLPIPVSYKRETPGTDSDLNAYDVVYYAGEANTGSKTIAINLPNDEVVQLEKGTRRIQLKNAMQAKFDSILTSIADILIADDQRQYVTFEAFFANTMFHEVAHGLGIKNTINSQGTVREALREHYSPMEEGKADILGLYMVTQLLDADELPDANLRDHYVTFLASIFRSVRFGASSAHGRANMVRFNFFQERGAFTRDPETGQYRVDFATMQEAMTALSERILTIQGDGDYESAGVLLTQSGIIKPELQNDLDRLAAAGIPVDIVFEQGTSVLDLR